jgi:NhaP-type Na+/H+ or K+/H+ antiporter
MRSAGRRGELRIVTTNQILVGVGLTVALAVGAQILAQRLRLPALILLLPFGFIAGALTDTVNPDRLLGPAFPPLVSLAVAVILYDAGLSLDLARLTGHPRRAVVRLIAIGTPLTCVVTAWVAAPLLGLSRGAALMLGAIVVVSGPTVVGPLLEAVRPSERTQHILAWEGSLIDPVGGILGATVFAVVAAQVKPGAGRQLVQFGVTIGVGLAGAVVALALLWLLLRRVRLGEVLGTSAQLATVIVVAAGCDVIRDDSGLLAAVVVGVAVANLSGFDLPERRPFFEVLVQLVLGLLFVSISATVSPASLRQLVLPTLGLVAVLVLVVRPVVALLSTAGTELGGGERGLIGWMAPRGIVAAATAATFGASLTAKGVGGAARLLPVTFLVIVVTVTLYGLTAGRVARLLGVVRSARSRPLLVGGEGWVVEVARALRHAGLDVLTWAGAPDDRDRLVAAGFPLAPDGVVAAATGKGARIEGVTAVLLLTGEHDFNALAVGLLVDTVDGGIYRSAPPGPEHGVVAPFAGAQGLLFDGLTPAALQARLATGSRILVRPATDGLPRGHDLLFVVDPDGRLWPSTVDDPAQPSPADTMIVLTP